MKRQHTIAALAATLLLTASCSQPAAAPRSIKETFEGKFLMGVALSQRYVAGRDTAVTRIVKEHFNSIVAENEMKCERIHPREDSYNFAAADRFVQFGEENGMAIIGHCLVWHSQCAPWFFVDEQGNTVSPQVLRQRIKEHINTVVTRYKGRIKGWDVVNEAIVEDGSYRKSPFYQILGEEFIPWAFECAHEADPDAELYLNDYGMDNPGRRNAYVKLIGQLKERGLRIDAIGMQSHIGIDNPDIDRYEESLNAFVAAGVKVMITELDMSALPSVSFSANVSDTVAFRKSLNPYPDGLPDSVSVEWNERMKQFFDLYLRHADDITRITAWGVTDGDSWKNNFPVRGRRDYPLLFDRNYQMKPFMQDYCKNLK